VSAGGTSGGPTTHDLCKRIARLSVFVKNVDIVPRGHIRIETTFLYPDGSTVDVFLVNDPIRLRLSDLAQTAMSYAITDRAVIDRAAARGVERQGGALEMTIDDTDDSIEDGIEVLARACVMAAVGAAEEP
jgi:hypothetical protein